MNRTLTVEIKDIPEEVWEFLISEKGSEEAVDALIGEMLTAKATTAIVLIHQMHQAQKAGIPLSSLIPEVVDKITEGIEGSSFEDEAKLETERKVSEIFDKLEAKKHAAD